MSRRFCSMGGRKAKPSAHSYSKKPSARRKKSPKAPLRLGTRGSALALWQAHHVKALLAKAHPDLSIKLRVVKTEGDRLKTPLTDSGGKGLFVKDIESALLRKEIDAAVHSFKDMPADLPTGLCLSAVLRRGEARDALVAKRKGLTLDTLPRRARVATGSLRRKAELLRRRPDLRVVPIRGNVPTRLRKLRSGNFDALLLAGAGLKRLGLQDEIAELLSPSVMIPSPAQGAVAVECRRGDRRVIRLLKALHHAPTALRTRAERAFLKAAGGDCKTPLGAYATLRQNRLTLRAFLATLDGQRAVYGKTSGEARKGRSLGAALARTLLRELDAPSSL